MWLLIISGPCVCMCVLVCVLCVCVCVLVLAEWLISWLQLSSMTTVILYGVMFVCWLWLQLFHYAWRNTWVQFIFPMAWQARPLCGVWFSPKHIEFCHFVCLCRPEHQTLCIRSPSMFACVLIFSHEITYLLAVRVCVNAHSILGSYSHIWWCLLIVLYAVHIACIIT